jgi:hypothetical protein
MHSESHLNWKNRNNRGALTGRIFFSLEDRGQETGLLSLSADNQ